MFFCALFFLCAINASESIPVWELGSNAIVSVVPFASNHLESVRVERSLDGGELARND